MSRRHERRNILHTLVGLLELATHDWEDIPPEIEDPLVRALLVGKVMTAEDQGVRLSVSGCSRLSRRPGSAGDLITILGNLIDNAVDALAGHPPAAGDEPRVEVRLHERESVTELRVADNGPGVPPERRQWIFIEGASTKRHTGAGHRGLGLALVGRLAHEREGTVSVSERAGGGAVFTVRLPGKVSSGERYAS
ncbi:sensor histidine kinase [Streptomyces sp. enrichment culture]|uniref:sensor histidine kinase n=1 Tax=Streptomyces sp. enrichment culture TaxID=1795815 RepID=UPI003F5794FE